MTESMIPMTTDPTQAAADWLANHTRLVGGNQLADTLEMLAARLRTVGELPRAILRVDIHVCDSKASDLDQRAAVDRLASPFGLTAQQGTHYAADAGGLHIVTTAMPPIPDQRTALLEQLAKLDAELKALPAEPARPTQDDHLADYGVDPGPAEHYEVSGSRDGDMQSKVCNCGTEISGSAVEVQALFADHVAHPDGHGDHSTCDPALCDVANAHETGQPLARSQAWGVLHVWLTKGGLPVGLVQESTDGRLVLHVRADADVHRYAEHLTDPMETMGVGTRNVTGTHPDMPGWEIYVEQHDAPAPAAPVAVSPDQVEGLRLDVDRLAEIVTYANRLGEPDELVNKWLRLGLPEYKGQTANTLLGLITEFQVGPAAEVDPAAEACWNSVTFTDGVWAVTR